MVGSPSSDGVTKISAVSGKPQKIYCLVLGEASMHEISATFPSITMGNLAPLIIYNIKLII